MLAAQFDKLTMQETSVEEREAASLETETICIENECQTLKKKLAVVEKKNKEQTTQIIRYLNQEKENSAAWKKLQRTLESKIANLERQLNEDRSANKENSSPEKKIVKRIAEFVATHNKKFDSLQRQWNDKLKGLDGRLKNIDSKVQECNVKVQTEKDILAVSKISKKCARDMAEDLQRRLNSTDDVRTGKRDAERKRMKELQDMMMFYCKGYDKLTMKWHKEKDELTKTIERLQKQLQRRDVRAGRNSAIKH